MSKRLLTLNRRAIILMILLMLAALFFWNSSLTRRVGAVSNSIVISQVYGGGGNSGTTYKNDFIELFNRGGSPVSVNGWSVQYQSAAGTGTWLVTNLTNVTIQPGQYYLVQEAQGTTGGTTNLPTPDATGTINLSATTGKVALVNTTTALTGGCPTSGIVDLIGYGSTATCFETAVAPGLSNTTADIRNGNGCTDTDNNSSDFTAGSPVPRNTASSTNVCSAGGSLSATGSANPSGPGPGDTTLLTVTVTPATSPTSTGITVTGDLTSIGGSATQTFYDDATHGDVTAGDNVFSFSAQVAANTTTGAKTIPISVADAQSRTATTNISLSVTSPTCGVERWSVKTGTDPDAPLVDLSHPTPVTISTMRGWPAPGTPPDNARVAPYEETVWVVNATMTLYKKETDVDYHIVIQDRAGNTIVTEIPCPCCVGQSSPFLSGVTTSRQKFDAKLSATTSFQSATIPVRLKGVGFFDFLHGQTGVAPNGIELHPILDIVFYPTVIGISNFDGDSKGDVAVWSPSSRNWYVLNSSTNQVQAQIDWGSGALGDIAVPGDYDGDGKTDFAVWRPSEGNWYVINSSTGQGSVKGWGQNGDVPVAGDYDGDGKTDLAVYRPSEGNWYILNSSTNTVMIKGWGLSTDIPVPGDYDGDGLTDVTVYRPNEGNWYIQKSSGGITIQGWGISTDKLVPADYDGDGKVDIAVYRPSEGNWYIMNSAAGTITVRGWGTSTDKPVPADYDGDGKADIAVWRPSEGNWYIIQSSNGNVRVSYLGGSTDVPVPSAYLPQ